MKKYTLYESFGAIDDDILERSEKRVNKRVPGKMTRWGALAACACLAVATAFFAQEFFAPDTRNNVEELTGHPLEEAAQDIVVADGEDAVGYDASGRSGNDVHKLAVPSDASVVTDTSDTPEAAPSAGGSAPGVGTDPARAVADDDESLLVVEKEKEKVEADFSGSPSDFRETLTLQEGLATEILGDYLLAEAPRGFVASVKLSRGAEGDTLFAYWTKSGAYDYIEWKVSLYSEADTERVTAAADTRNYDMSLYPIPLCESVPEELRQIVDHPIFSAEELTQDVVNRRAHYVNDSGDTSGPRMNLGVLYGEVLVEVTAKGVSTEWLYERLSDLRSDTP